MTKTVDWELLKRVTSIEGVSIARQYSRRERLEVVGIQSSADDINLQSTVCSVLCDIDVVCDSNDCKRVKGDRTIAKFNSPRNVS